MITIVASGDVVGIPTSPPITEDKQTSRVLEYYVDGNRQFVDRTFASNPTSFRLVCTPYRTLRSGSMLEI